MSRLRLWFLFPVLLASALASGQEATTGGRTSQVAELARVHPTRSLAISATADTQAVVFFAKTRPVFLVFHIERDQKPFRAVWNDYLLRTFEENDSNHDSLVDNTELKRVLASELPLDDLTGRRLFAEFARLAPRASGVLFIDAARLAGQYAEPFHIQASSQIQSGAGRALFPLLDRDENNLLTAAELLPLDAKLRQLDLNEDETLSLSELDPFGSREAEFVARYVSPGRQRPPRVSKSSEFLPVSPERDARKLLRELIARYDTLVGAEADHQLSLQEMMLPRELFAQFDANHDAKLDLEELHRFVTEFPPALEIRVRLGTMPRVACPRSRGHGTPRPVEVIRRAEPTAAEDPGAGSDAKAVLDLDGMELRFTTAEAMPLEEIRKVYQSRFEALAGDDDLLTALEARRDPVFGTFFNPMDKDADGKVTEREFLAFVDRRSEAAAHGITLWVAQTSRTLFDALDENGDGRLDLHEMYGMAGKFRTWDRDADEQLGTDEIPTHYRISIGPGAPDLPAVDAEAMSEAESFLATSEVTHDSSSQDLSAKPLWFHRMNRNGDDYLSPREFLGPRSVFQRCDVNGDGLISLSEAVRFGR